MAYGRIASSCAIMSRTQGTIGIGMLSLELMGHCDAREIAAPVSLSILTFFSFLCCCVGSLVSMRLFFCVFLL